MLAVKWARLLRKLNPDLLCVLASLARYWVFIATVQCYQGWTSWHCVTRLGAARSFSY